MAIADPEATDASEEASQAPPLRIIAGDELGQLRVCQAPVDRLGSLATSDTWAQPDRSRGIERLTVSAADQAAPAVYIASGQVDGSIEIRDAADGAVAACIEASTSNTEDESHHIRGLHFVTVPGSKNGRSLLLVSCTSGGLVQSHRQPEQSGSTDRWHLESSWQGPSNVQATAFSQETLSLAFACKGSELSIWDLLKGERTYHAKSAKPSNIGLMDPSWNTAVAFLPGTKGSQIVVGTGMHKVRLYNTQQRRPILSIDFGESRITALAPHTNGDKCWVADSQGQIGCVDLRLGKVQQSLKGVAGSVRSLIVHEEANVIISAGLDRFLRLHDITTRKPIARVYLKHHLVGAVICPEPQAEPAEVSAPEIAAAAGDLREALPRERKKKKKKKSTKLEGQLPSKKLKVSASK